MLVNRKAIILILTGSLLWSLTMVKSGILYEYGMGFWGPNGHDGIWHISIAKSLSKGDWEMPVFAGEEIQNYHLGFDLLLVFLHKITFIPIVNLYFQILPPATAVLIGYLVYKFVLEWTRSENKAWWSTFFVYFGGSWGWLVGLIRDGTFGGESMFWAHQSVSTLINPPFALSLVVLFAALYLLIQDFHKRSNKHLFLVSLLFGVLIQIKVYAGLLALTGLLVSGFWRMLQRKGIELVKVFLGAFLISLFIFSPTSGEIGSLVEFRPFWFIETMMQFTDRLGWQRYAEAMVNYRSGSVWVKGIIAYSVALFIFWFGNLGSRIVKEPQFFGWIKNFKELDFMQMLLLTVIAAGITVPTLFVQTGTPWNTIQFLYYSLMLSGVLAGVAVGDFRENSGLSTSMIYIIEVVIILMTIPTTLATLGYHYLPSRPPAMIGLSELEALQFLSDQPDGVVLKQPFDRYTADEALSDPPRSLYAYESTAYISALSGQKVLLEDQVNLDITGYDWKSRRNSIEQYFDDPEDAFLGSNHIKYIYVVKKLGQPKLSKEIIFENNEVIIYSTL